MLPHAPTNERTEAGMQPHEELSDVSTTSGYGDDDAHESDTGSSGETRKNKKKKKKKKHGLHVDDIPRELDRRGFRRKAVRCVHAGRSFAFHFAQMNCCSLAARIGDGH